MRQFQIETGAAPRPNSQKCTYRFGLLSVRTLRSELIHLSARIARPYGKNALRIAAAPASRQYIREIERKLAA